MCIIALGMSCAHVDVVVASKNQKAKDNCKRVVDSIIKNKKDVDSFFCFSLCCANASNLG